MWTGCNGSQVRLNTSVCKTSSEVNGLPCGRLVAVGKLTRAAKNDDGLSPNTVSNAVIWEGLFKVNRTPTYCHEARAAGYGVGVPTGSVYKIAPKAEKPFEIINKAI